ncbi:MAG: hypothetical protein KAH15_00910 [Candidatus Marinimicrobia bacterium]|nr:hypothetical protein [Candidatus Neomarinimicrobiota bacterium]
MYIFNQKENIFSNTKVDKNGLSGYFANKTQFSVHEIQEYYERKEPDIKTATVNWRIYDLVQKNLINRIGRGKYTLNLKMIYKPYLTDDMADLFNNIKRNFPYLDICVWSNLNYNEFMIHQPWSKFSIVEVEEDSLLPVLYYIRDVHDDYTVILESDFEIFERYFPINAPTVIIKQIVTESPLLKLNNITTASLEKILIDLFCDVKLFDAYQGNEMNTIFKEAMSKYVINYNRMIRYASRRGKKEKFLNYIQENQINGSNL